MHRVPFPCLVLCLACLSACAASKAGPVASSPQEIPPQWIQIGMKENQISSRLGPPIHVVGVKEYPDGRMEVRLYIVNRVNYLEETASKKQYYLYFWNRELVHWDIPGDWESEADMIRESLRFR